MIAADTVVLADDQGYHVGSNASGEKTAHVPADDAVVESFFLDVVLEELGPTSGQQCWMETSTCQ